MVSEYYIICRSLTYAQRTEAALGQAGIPGRLLRAPKSVSPNGCSYGVRIPEGKLSQGLAVLKKAGLSPVKVLVGSEAEGFREAVP